MTRRYAKDTDVTAQRTRQEIEALLQKFGCAQFGVAQDNERHLVTLAFVFHGQPHRIVLPLPNPSAQEFTHYRNPNAGSGWTPRPKKRQYSGQASTTAEAVQQATDSRWRALLLMLRAQLEYADLTSTDALLALAAYRVLSNGRTVAEQITDTGNPPALTWGNA